MDCITQLDTFYSKSDLKTTKKTYPNIHWLTEKLILTAAVQHKLDLGEAQEFANKGKGSCAIF